MIHVEECVSFQKNVNRVNRSCFRREGERVGGWGWRQAREVERTAVTGLEKDNGRFAEDEDAGTWSCGWKA